ncbi:D-alanine--D-alanine ligase [Streptococcus suis]|uniref:ATP-grasp domain-containing protein n=1 Tax=Streptococcus suis TaxID=1307 RepID=UPI00160D6047|nr:ATP-grasp domain-containing protein [Streptococcus suis]BCK43649.1 D-alanine--D-alanine ligase [Streptococcus suis]HEL1622249.1 ATP-grasp domain-containing protein [Streptococcus suis]
MKLVVILNVNPNPNVHEKISDNREYTCRELKNILEENFLKFVKEVTFYDNFEYFKINVQKHLNDFVLNFDFGYKSRTRNMNVPAFCENYNIKYFNPDPYVQVLCQDKFMTEKFAESFGIKVPKSLLVFAHSYTKEILANFEYPIIIKPNYESESIGITQNSIVENMEQADMALKQLMKDFDGILVEEYIEGREVAITILENEGELFFEEVELIFPEYSEFKYQAYTSEIKQKIGVEIEKSCYLSDKDIINLKQLYKNLSPNKLIRVDGRIKNAEFYLIEINANPGLYPKSVVPKTFNINGYTYDEMIQTLFTHHLN